MAGALHVLKLAFSFSEWRPLAEFQELFGRRGRKQMDAPGDEPGPPRLVAGAKPRSVVAMEVFVEQQEIAPLRVFLKLPRAAVHRSPTILVSEEDIREAT